jgi:hypothetical protein
MDIVAASYEDDMIAWYQNDGTTVPSFTQHVVNSHDADGDSSNAHNGDADRPSSVFAFDMDQDGDLDIISASEEDDRIAWYPNLNEAEFGDAPAPFETSMLQGGAAHVPVSASMITTIRLPSTWITVVSSHCLAASTSTAAPVGMIACPSWARAQLRVRTCLTARHLAMELWKLTMARHCRRSTSLV